MIFLTKQESKRAALKEDESAIEERMGILSRIALRKKPCSDTGSWFNVVVKDYGSSLPIVSAFPVKWSKCH